MHTYRSDARPGPRGPYGLLAFAVVLCTAAPGLVDAQERDIVSKAITVGPAEASLTLEFDDGLLDVSMEDGVVEIDGDEVGRLESGDALERAWRQLLGSAVTMDGDALASMLVEWNPPSGLTETDFELGQRIDRALESALASVGLSDPAREGVEAPDRRIEALLSRSDRLGELGAALEGADLDDAQVRIAEDVLIARDTELDGTLIAVDSDVRIEGTVRGDVIVVDGALRLAEGGRVTGDVRLADSRLVSDEGVIEGRLVEISTSEESRPAIGDVPQGSVPRNLERAPASTRADGLDFFRPVRAIGRGLAGLVTTGVNVGFLVLLGWVVVYLAGDNLAVVARTARRSTGRSAVVGLAGTFLILPVWVLGALALVITIVGIFALPFWLILFPVAVAVAAGLGFYGVASSIGEQLSRGQHPFLRRLRSSNGYALLASGLIALAVPFALSNVAKMAVVLGLLEVLLFIAGCVALTVAAVVGFGAVLLTRGGRQPEFDWGGTLDDDPGGTPGPASDPGGGSPGSGDPDWFGGKGHGEVPQEPDPTVTA